MANKEQTVATPPHRNGDSLQRFLNDCCLTYPIYYVKQHTLFAAYLDWSDERGTEQPMDRAAFYAAVAAQGFRASRSLPDGNGRQYRGWVGLALKGAGK